MNIMGSTSIEVIERVPRYSISKGERGSKWLIAELYSFLQNFKKIMLGQNEEEW